MTVHSFATPGQPGPFAIPTDNLIGDAWQSNGGGRIDIVDPSNGNVLTSVADAGVEEAIAAVDAADKAAAAWAATAPRQRAEIMRRSVISTGKAGTSCTAIWSVDSTVIAIWPTTSLMKPSFGP